MALFVAVLIVLFVLKVIDVLLLVFLAILLAVYLSAITDYLEHRFAVKRWLGLTLAVLVTVAGIASVAALLAPPVVEQTRALVGGHDRVGGTDLDGQPDVIRHADEHPAPDLYTHPDQYAVLPGATDSHATTDQHTTGALYGFLEQCG